MKLRIGHRGFWIAIGTISIILMFSLVVKAQWENYEMSQCIGGSQTLKCVNYKPCKPNCNPDGEPPTYIDCFGCMSYPTAKHCECKEGTWGCDPYGGDSWNCGKQLTCYDEVRDEGGNCIGCGSPCKETGSYCSNGISCSSG